MTAKCLPAIAAVVLAATAAAPAQAKVYTVDPAVGGSACTAGATPQCPTLALAAAALNGAADLANGDVLQITPGTYAESVSFSGTYQPPSGASPGTALAITRRPGTAGEMKVTGNGTAAPLRFTGPGPYKVSGLEILASGGNANGLEFAGNPGDSIPKTLTLESDVLSGAGSGNAALWAKTLQQSPGGTMSITARHVTIADKGTARAMFLDQSLSAAGAITVAAGNSVLQGPIATAGAVSVDTSHNNDKTTAPGLLFVNQAAEDFRLRASAPNVMSSGGAAEGGETAVDVEGQARPSSGWDKGADEFTDAGPPTAPALAVDQKSPEAGSAVTFTASGVTDPDQGETFTYVWNFGDGTPETRTSTDFVTHVYAAPGAYAATVRAADVVGAQSGPSDPLALSVLPARPGPGAPGGGGGTGGGGGLPTARILRPSPGQIVATARRARVRRGGRWTRRTIRLPIRLSGRAAAEPGLRRVELALTLLRGSTCRSYDGARTLRSRRCDRPIYFRARINDFAWTFAIPASVRLPRGSYVLAVRATDLTGAASPISAAGRSLVRFRLR